MRGSSRTLLGRMTVLITSGRKGRVTASPLIPAGRRIPPYFTDTYETIYQIPAYGDAFPRLRQRPRLAGGVRGGAVEGGQS